MIDAEDSAGTPIPKGTGDAAWTATRIRRHRTHHENTKAPQPIAHRLATSTRNNPSPRFRRVRHRYRSWRNFGHKRLIHLLDDNRYARGRRHGPPNAVQPAHQPASAAKKGPETSPKPPATDNTAHAPGCFSRAESGDQRFQQTAWIATGGLRWVGSRRQCGIIPASPVSQLFDARLSQRGAGLAQFLRSQFPRLDQVRHDRQSPAAEQRHQIVDHSMLRGIP